MKELLREFLATLLNEDTSAAQQAKDAGLKYIPGSRGLWSQSGKKPATHSTKDGKFVALTSGQSGKSAQRGASPPTSARTKKGTGSGGDGMSPHEKKPAQEVPRTITEPIITPGGNKILGKVTPEQIVNADTTAQKVIDSRAATSDELTDVDLTPHRSRQLPRSQEDYYAEMETRGLVRKPIVRFDDQTRQTLLNSGVSEAHIDLLERAINTRRDGTKPKMTELTGGPSGKGIASAQAGEVCALVLMAVPASQRGAVGTALSKMLGESAAGDKSILEKEWVVAGMAQSEAFDAMMDTKYGKGNWVVEASAWDTPDDIAGIGLDQKNKGFSTDIALRVRVQGITNAQAARISLKKDGNSYLFNGTAQDVVRFATQNLGEKEQQEYAELSGLLQIASSASSPPEDKKNALKQLQAKFGGAAAVALKTAKQRVKEIEDMAVDSLPEPTRTQVETIRSWPQRQQQSAITLANSLSGKPSATDAELDAAAVANPRNRWDASERELAKKAHEVLSKLPLDASEQDIMAALKVAGLPSDREGVRKAAVFAGAVEAQRDAQVKQELEKHHNLGTEAENATIEAMAGNDAVRAGLLVKLEEAFPIRVIATGQESMCLGGIPVSRETCVQLFGTDNPADIQRGLTLVEKDGRKVLIYRATSGKQEVVVATVEARQRGKGYAGSIELGFKPTEDFECKAAKANVDAGMNTPANAKTVANCERKYGSQTRNI